MNSGRHWASIIERFSNIYGQISSALNAASTVGAKSTEAAKLDVLISKVARAQHVVEQLQQLKNREAALKHQYDDLLRKVAPLEQQLTGSEVRKMEDFADSEGLQPLVAQLKGWSHAKDARQSDPFGIMMGYSPSNPHAPMSWGTYLAALKKLQQTTKAVLDIPSLEQLLQFSRQRRLLLQEMHSLQRNLEAEVQLPSLAPLDEHLQHLDDFVARVVHAQRVNLRMLQRDLGQLQPGMLEVKLKIDMGSQYHGSEEQRVIDRIKPQCQQVLDQGTALSVTTLEALRADLQHLVRLVLRRKAAQIKPALSTLAETGLGRKDCSLERNQA